MGVLLFKAADNVDEQLKVRDFKDGIKIIESLQKEFKF